VDYGCVLGSVGCYLWILQFPHTVVRLRLPTYMPHGWITHSLDLQVTFSWICCSCLRCPLPHCVGLPFAGMDIPHVHTYTAFATYTHTWLVGHIVGWFAVYHTFVDILHMLPPPHICLHGLPHTTHTHFVYIHALPFGLHTLVTRWFWLVGLVAVVHIHLRFWIWLDAPLILYTFGLPFAPRYTDCPVGLLPLRSCPLRLPCRVDCPCWITHVTPHIADCVVTLPVWVCLPLWLDLLGLHTPLPLAPLPGHLHTFGFTLYSSLCPAFARIAFGSRITVLVVLGLPHVTTLVTGYSWCLGLPLDLRPYWLGLVTLVLTHFGSFTHTQFWTFLYTVPYTPLGYLGLHTHTQFPHLCSLHLPFGWIPLVYTVYTQVPLVGLHCLHFTLCPTFITLYLWIARLGWLPHMPHGWLQLHGWVVHTRVVTGSPHTCLHTRLPHTDYPLRYTLPRWLDCPGFAFGLPF